MNIMVDKGYLKRSKEGANYVYRPRVSEKAVTGRMLHDLVKRAFDGSAAAVVVGLLESADLDEAEIRELRALLDSQTGEKPK